MYVVYEELCLVNEADKLIEMVLNHIQDFVI